VKRPSGRGRRTALREQGWGAGCRTDWQSVLGGAGRCGKPSYDILLAIHLLLLLQPAWLALGTQGKYARREANYHAALRHNQLYPRRTATSGNLFRSRGVGWALASYELALIHDPQSASTHGTGHCLAQVGDLSALEGV